MSRRPYSGIHFSCTSHDISFKPLSAFPHNLCSNNVQRWERNKWVLLQWLLSILGRNIGPAGDRTSDPFSQVLYARLSYAAHSFFQRLTTHPREIFFISKITNWLAAINCIQWGFIGRNWRVQSKIRLCRLIFMYTLRKIIASSLTAR